MEKDKTLKEAGLKVTHPRVLILGILQKQKDQHISAEDIYNFLLESNADIGLATIYRVLNQFNESGIVDKHHFEGGKSLFELSTEKHHDHLLCLKCGKIIEFEDSVIEQRQKDIARKHKMKLTNHSLYLYGECKKNCDS